jgi:hypothetical protein
MSPIVSLIRKFRNQFDYLFSCELSNNFLKNGWLWFTTFIPTSLLWCFTTQLFTFWPHSSQMMRFGDGLPVYHIITVFWFVYIFPLPPRIKHGLLEKSRFCSMIFLAASISTFEPATFDSQRVTIDNGNHAQPSYPMANTNNLPWKISHEHPIPIKILPVNVHH